MGMRDYVTRGFRENYKIMQLTDIHLVRVGMGGPEDRIFEMIRNLVEMEKPDMIVITGDTVYTDASNNCVSYFRTFMDQFQIPWCYVMGNHDDNDGPGYETLEPILYDTPYGLYRHGNADVTGFGNYMVGLIDDARKPVWLLYMLATHDGRRYEHKFYPDQIQWYRERRELFREVRGQYSPSLFFFHIPLVDYEDVWASGKAVGVNLEGVAHLDEDTGFFAAIAEKGDAKGVFVGHDHMDDFAGMQDGVLLAYGRATTQETEFIEGMPRSGYLHDGFQPGCRLIELHGDGSFRTWVRLHDGTELYKDAEF